MVLKPKVSASSRAYRPKLDDEPKGKKAIGRNIGKLTEILNVPMDVFFEITSHLKPIDLLQLARTSKELRAMLLSRTSRHIWVAARRNIVPRMPDCPDYMSEAQYAHLVFERICDACGVNKSVNVDYAIPARLCGACWKENVRNGGKLERELRIAPNMRENIYNLLPVAHMAAYSYYQDPATALAQTSRNTYYEPEYTAVAKRYAALSKSKKKGALERFVDERKADAVKRWNFNLAVAQWERGLHDEAQRAVEEVRKDRVAAVEEKLRELGYARSDFPPNDAQILQMMDQPRKLTPRIWNNIRPRIIAILEEERERRTVADFRTKWHKRREQLKQHYQDFLAKGCEHDRRRRMLPGFEDAMVICLDVLTGAEPEADVTDEEYAAFDSLVLSNAAEYRARVIRDLATLVRADGDDVCLDKPKKAKKGKGKRKATEGDSSDSDEASPDPDDALALLETPTAQFECNRVVYQYPACVGAKSYLGMIEHWQEVHGGRLWSPDSVDYADSRDDAAKARAMRWLLNGLGLSHGATMSAVETALREGRPECSCSWTPTVTATATRLPRADYFILCSMLSHGNFIGGTHKLILKSVPSLTDPQAVLDTARESMPASGIA
ncbi:hypothetical protein BC628DRAFT_1415246 [Trametes gibbosa]|nr:hypothetical protein BC628DRAFT_1415246 [Trametes gibbosa]